MNTRSNNQKLFSISEDAEHKLHDHKPHHHGFDEELEYLKTNLGFQDSVKLNAFRKSPRKLFEKPNLADKDLYFLKQNATIIDFDKKNEELEKIIENYKYLNDLKTHKFENVKQKIYENRNPNIKNFLKDLKSEFNAFLDEKANDSVEGIRRLSIMDKTEPYFRQEQNWNFLTQNESDNVNNQLLTTETKLDAENKTSLSLKKSTPRLRTSESKELQPVEAPKEEEKKENQLVIVNQTFPDKQKTIELKKNLDSIKRIDLPKFQTEIHQVCQYGKDPELLKLYPQELEKGFNSKQNGLGRYCIHECCVKGNAGMLKGLLPFVDNINSLDQDKRNAAQIACKHGELECLKILVANGINLEHVDAQGLQVSHIVAQYNHPAIIEFLFETGLPLNVKCNKGKLPYHYAAEYGSFETLKVLADYYIDFTVSDNDGNTAAHLAAKNDRLNCLRYLIHLGLPIDKVRNNFGWNVAHVCCFYGSVRSLHWLFENKLDIHALDDNGNNLAHTCCLNGQAECLNCCIQHDVDINKLNKHQETPMDLARKVGKSLHMEKAVKNKIKCDSCVRIALQVKWDIEHAKTEAEKTIEKNQDKMYSTDSLSAVKHSVLRNRKQVFDSFAAAAAEPEEPILTRDLVAQYFGPEL